MVHDALLLLRCWWFVNLDDLVLCHVVLDLELGDLDRFENRLCVLVYQTFELVNDLFRVIRAILLAQLLDEAVSVRG